ncbi:hypothetical protein AB751O23_AA_00520 [Chlamydiales bacterium SCGC AB-751-O23]|jgi:hypothetical protein|nr:hypothetical protein AB751O23_AA_00520 [Chlamydiales bacterium SCGC AB-751-O23]
MDIRLIAPLSVLAAVGTCYGLWVFRKAIVKPLENYRDMLIHIEEVKKALNTTHLTTKKSEEIKASYIKLKNEKIKAHPNFSRQEVHHTSFNKGRSYVTQKELANLIYEDLDFMQEVKDIEPSQATIPYPHCFFRFLERISIFYADREPNKGLLIPSPDGDGFLEVIEDFSLPQALSATLYKKVGVSDPEHFLVLRGTGVFPEQSRNIEAVYEDCQKTIGESTRTLTWDQLKKHLPKENKCSLIGMSLGGAQAMILYSKFPDKFSKLITVNSPYVSESDNELLKVNCSKTQTFPDITALQTYGDYVQDLGVAHIGAGFNSQEGRIVLHLLKEEKKEGHVFGKEAKGLFCKRFENLKNKHEKFSLCRLFTYTLKLIWHLRDEHQKNITRGPYLFETITNKEPSFERHITHRKDFRMRFEKTRQIILFPLAKIIPMIQYIYKGTNKSINEE